MLHSQRKYNPDFFPVKCCCRQIPTISLRMRPGGSLSRLAGRPSHEVLGTCLRSGTAVWAPKRERVRLETAKMAPRLMGQMARCSTVPWCSGRGPRTERTVFGGPSHWRAALPPGGQRLSNLPCRQRPAPQTAKGLPLVVWRPAARRQTATARSAAWFMHRHSQFPGLVPFRPPCGYSHGVEAARATQRREPAERCRTCK
jgi:hypothetical protein